jgi:hypothetical protein
MMNPFTSSGQGIFKKRITKSLEWGAFGNSFFALTVPPSSTAKD